jgi:Ca2+-binding EF-hand superfamily protein
MISGLSGSGNSALLQQMRERMMSRLDTDGDGSISQAEFSAGRPQGASQADATARFAQIDTDGNGSLSASELATAFTQFTAQTAGALLMAQGTQGGDSSASGTGTGAVGGCEGGGGRSRAMADQLFGQLDSNSDGSVSKSELEAAFQSVASANGTDATAATQQADDLFSKLDTDGDGSVSQSEVEQAMKPHGHHHHHHHGGGASAANGASADAPFAQLDANGDGSISKSEFAAATGQSTAATTQTAASSGSGTGDTGTNSSDPPQTLLATLQNLVGQQTTNSVRSQMMDLLLKLQQSSGTTQAAAAA